MGAPEAAIENYLVKRVKETGGRTRKLTWIAHRGAPDRMVWWPRRNMGATIIFLEVKAPGKKPNAQQQRVINGFIDDGIIVGWVDSKDRVDAFVNTWSLLRDKNT